jgi:hypothetical protein
MTNEEVIELAKQNNAYLTPEETEKCRQETIEFFERHKVTSDWLGSFYLVDTHNPIQRFVDKIHTGLVMFGLFLMFIFALLYLPFILFYVIGFIKIWLGF